MRIVPVYHKLRKNPNHQWGTRSEDDILGVCFHQQLGDGHGFTDIKAVNDYHVDNSHMRKGGVHSAPYTYAISKEGTVYQLNPVRYATWSQGYKPRPGDENKQFIGVMFQGNFSRGSTKTGEPTRPQLVAGFNLWEHLCNRYLFTPGDIWGHYHFGKPSCPGTTLQCIIDSIRLQIADNSEMFEYTDRGLQLTLAALGYYGGAIDGIIGPVSRRAIDNYQSATGFETGPVTPYQKRYALNALWPDAWK